MYMEETHLQMVQIVQDLQNTYILILAIRLQE